MKVKFVPQDIELEIKPGQTVMDLAHQSKVPIRSTCNGMPSCAECRVRVIDGEWNTNPPSRKELNLIGTGHYIDQRRLSCQLLCFGDVTIDTTEQVEKIAEGPVTKKFLTKVHKSSPQESHSLGGVLIEQDGELLSSLKSEVATASNDTNSDVMIEKPRVERSIKRNEDRSHQQSGEGQKNTNRGNRRGGRGRRR